MAKKRNKSLEEIFKGTGVNISSTQPTSVAEQNKAIQKQGSWGNTGSGTGGTRIVGTGGGTMQHTDAGAQKVAALSGSKYSKAGAVVDAFSRGVGKTTKTNNAATAFKPAPVMSKPKQTKQDRLATVSAELDAMRNQRTQLVKDSVGKKAQTQKITELNSKIQKAKDEQKKLEKDVYGYTGNFFSDTAKRIGRTLSGATQSVVGTAAETVGQIGRFGADADDPRIYATTGAMINEARNPGALQRQHQATQGRVQSAFDTSDMFAEESARNIESAKGGLGTLGKLAVDVGSEGLKLAGDMALNTVVPGSGLAAMGVRAFGGGAQEARQAGATGDQQFLYGASTAGIEMLTEKMFSAALPFKQAYGGAARVGGKTLDDAMDAVIGKVVKSPAVRALAHNFIGEGIEEQASDLLNPVAKLIYDKDAVHDTYLTAEGRQQLAEDLLLDGLVGAILGGLGATGNVVSNVAVGNRLMKNGGSGAANVLASAASFPEQSEAHKTATELIERHDQGGEITPYELGDLVHQMQEAAAHGVYPDETGGTYEVLRDAKGNWRVVHQINETAQALNEKGVDTKDAIKYAAVLDSLAQSDDMSVSQVKRKLDVFSPAVREQVEQMTGRALPEATSKADTARAIKAAFTEYRSEVEEEERLAEAERKAAAEAEEQAAIAEESDAQAAQFMEQAVAEQEQAVAQEQAQQAQQQQAEEPPLVQPLETLEEFLARKEEDAMRRYNEGLTEENRKELAQAWEQATKDDGIRLDDGTTVGFAEFAESMRPYLSKEEGYTLNDSKLMESFNRFRAASAEHPISRATWEKNIAATRGDTSAQPESVAAEETVEEEPGASVLSVEEEATPVEETPAEEPAAAVMLAAEETTPTAEEEVPYAEQPNEPHRNPMSPFAEKNAEKVAQHSEKQREEVAAAQKKQTQQKKTRQKKQTVIPTKAEAEAAKTATQNAETAEEGGGSAESIQNAIKTLRESGAKTQRDVFDSTGKSAKESVRLSQAYWLLQDNGLISVKSDGSFTIKNTTKNGGVKHSLATQSKNPNIKTNENVTLEQRLAAEFLMEYLKDKGIKGIVFDGKNLEGEDGHIDKSSGIIYLNEDYLDTAMAVAQTVGHEIFHAGVEGDANLVNAMLESAKQLAADGKLTGRNGRKAARWLNDIDAEVAERAERYRAFLEKAGADAATIAKETSPEAMREEIACDLMGMVLNNQSALDTIAQTEPTLLDRIIEALDRLLGGRYSRMANYATGGEDTSFAQYGKDYANTVKELDKIAERLSAALDNYRDGTRVVEPSELENSDARTLTEEMGDGTVVEADENGDLVFAQNKAEHSTAFSLATWQVGQAKLRRALEEEGHSKEEIDDIINRVDSIAEFIEDLGDEYAEMGYDKLKNNLIADIVTDVRTGKQVLSALVKNGDYPVNFDLALICKKRVAYMNLISRLVKDGVMDKVTFGAEAIAKVNEILRDRGFETACLGCFVESRRLQIQKWAETIVKEWNEEVDKRMKNAPDFGFAKGKNAELTVDDLAAIQQEYEGVDLNEKGNKKLKQASVKNKMGQLLNTTPSLLKHLTVEDLLTPQGISALRQRDGSLFSLVQQRYGAASPKIVQDFNPYNGEIADLSFEFVKDRFGDGIKGKDAYIADAKAELAVEEGGLPAKQKGESKEDFEKRKAEFNTRAENMAIRQYLYDIGGARIQSFSDFMIENVFDYIQIYADLAARKFPMHGYTKEIIALRLFGLTGQKWNGSLIAHSERSQGKELAGLLPVEEAKNGHGIVVTDPYTGEQYAICFDDYRRNQRTSKPAKEYLAAHGGKEENLSEAETQEYNRLKKQASFIQSIGMKDIFALQLDSRYSPFVGSITIGVSDAQIRAMLNHPLFSMVIPYHKSGMLPMYAELVGVDMYNDYTDYQNTRVGAVYGKDGKPLTRAVDLDGNPIPPKTVRGKKVDYAPGIYKKKDDGWTRVSADTRYDFNAKVQELGDAKAAAQAYIDWCYKDHPIYNGDDVVGYETFLPKFSDSPEGYDFTQEENYYKLLEDFVSYDTVTGEPVLQGDVQMTFPEADSLSADELDAYKQRLRDTGLYTAKEIERYAEKAQMGFKDIVREALDERKQYHDATDPQWEDTVSQVTNALLGDDHLRSTPVERQKAWAKEDKAAKKAAKQKGVKHSLPNDTAEMDREYMAAAQAGDVETAQRMVDEYARQKGYTIKAYHGTPAVNTETNPNYISSVIEAYKLLFPDKSPISPPGEYGSQEYKDFWAFASLWSNARWRNKVKSAYNIPDNLFRVISQGPVRQFTKFDQTRFGAASAVREKEPGLYFATDPYAASYFRSTYEWDSILGATVKTSVGDGYLYEVYLNPKNTVERKAHIGKRTFTEIIVRDPSKVKSADPITYDDNGNIIPLSERFRTDRTGEDEWKNRDIRYSLPTDAKQMDEEYMAAVESGDTARAQEMVDEAAKRAGYDIRAYHGTKADFTAFDKSRFGKNYGGFLKYGDGFYFALNNQSAERWAGKAKDDGEPRVMPVFLSSQRMLNVNDPVDSPAAAEYLKSIGTAKADINWYLTTGNRFIEAVKYREGQDGIQKVLGSLGYDGIADTLSSEHGQYVVFNPEQVKSSNPVTYDSDGNPIPLSERFNPKQSDIRYSLRRPVEGMYNLSDRVIENLPDGKIAVNQLMKKLSGGGVNADELHWLGIEDFLRGKKSVDKQELLDYIHANDLVLEEETLNQKGPGFEFITPDRSVTYDSWGDARDGAEELAKTLRYSEDDVEYDNQKRYFYVRDTESGEDKVLVREYNPEQDGWPYDETVWSRYTLPGGSRYREILFRMPNSDYQNDGSTRHWKRKAPGVLAHARVQDFPTADGTGKILFVEEIQSDWHNRGLKHGYIRDTDDPAVVQSQLDRKYQEDLAKWEKQHREIEDAIRTLYREKGVRDINYLFRQIVRMNVSELAQHVEEDGPDSLSQLYSIFYSDDPESAYFNSPISEDEIAALGMYYELLNERHRVNRKRPDQYYYKVSQMAPDAPYKDTYQNFVMKRLVREAAQKGYDGIAWTTGQMQVDRWDEKYRKAYELEYDKQIPKFLNKFGKPFGVKVETTQIETDDGLVTVPYFALNMPLRKSVRKDGTTKFSLRNTDEEQSAPSTPVSAFTEKGRKYSVRGQVPEFDAIFDFYANYGLTNDAPKAPPKPQVSRVRSKTYERMGVPRSFDEEHRQALDESEFEYDPIAEQESMRRAEERLTNDYEGEKKDLSKRNWRNGEDLDTAMGILATELNLAKETGDYDETIEWLHLIREQGTKAGQFIQAFAKYNRSPEGILARAVDDLEKSKLSSDERKELIQKITDFAATLSKLRPKADGSVDPNALVDLIVQQAKQRNTKVSKGSMKVLQRLVNEGDVQYLYNFALTQLDQIAKDYIPASLGRKVGTYQTISHLLNLRTGNRNLGSNTAFGSIAATANNVAMLPDAIFGLLTGNGRMVGLDRGHLSKETWHGIKEGGARARLGINLDVQPDTNARDKYGTSKRTWKMTGNFVQRQMSRVEKLMAYELNWTDEFRKGGVRAEIIQSLAPMVANGSISMEVAKEWAEQEALYRTFQDDTYVNKLLGNVKKLLNMKLVSEVDANGKKTYHIGQMDFGLGDIVQKYTQVPGALITRAIELSPAGYLKAIYLMGSMAKTASASKQAKTAYEVAKQTAAKSDKERLKRAANRAFEKSVKADVVAKSAQRDAALALGRAITGTGLIAAFAALAKAGLLKRADDEDGPDAKALKAAEGITGTQLNLSAIRRLINGESPAWKQGDVLASVEFLEPMNNEMTMGAKIAKSIAGGKNDLGTFTLDTFDALYQSMQEIPTMQTLQTINQTIQYHKEDDPLPVWAEIPIEIARSGMTGFVPALVRQTAQASDPYYRDAYTSRDLGDQIKDTVKNAIPGLRQQLPVKLDNFGRPKAQENQPLNALNAFIIPGSVRTYQQSKATGKLQTLYDQTGKANIFPDRSAPYNVSYSVDKQQTKFDLAPEERQKYQTTRGQVTLKTLVAAMDDMWYQNASADQKVEIVEKAKAYGNYKAKVEADAKQAQRDGRLDVYSDSEYEHIDTALNMGYNMSNYLLVKEKCNSFTADKNANGKSISGSKMKKIIEYLNSLNLTDQQKAYMFELTSGSNKTPFGSY